jgi:hypothetical protein
VGNYAARPIVTGAFWGISMLLTIIVIAKAESPWKYAIVVLPVSLFALTIYLLARAVKTPDPAGR